MSPRRGPIRWLHLLGLGRPRPDESVAWEIEHHIAELADRLVADGWSEGDARREAERRFGNPVRYGASMRRMERGRMRMMRRTRLFETVWDGVRGVGRTMRRSPGLALGIVLTLGLGIGANSTMYGIVDRLLLQPPDHIVDPDGVMRFYIERPSRLSPEPIVQTSLAFPDFVDMKAHSGFAGSAGLTPPREETVGSGGGATRARVAQATHELMPMLGVSPRMGRTFSERDDQVGAPLTAIVSQEYWRSRLGGDPAVIGTSLELSGHSHTVVGVAPRGFTGVGLAPVDVWLPLRATHTARGGGCLERRNCWWMHVAVRLADGASVDAAEAEATALHLNGRREQIDADDYPGRAQVLLGPLIGADGPSVSAETRVARWLTAVSAIVLLIACANVANLLLARASGRRREISVRLALGVSRGRLVSQMMIESLVVALVGGALALALARWGGGLVRSVLLPGVYFPDSAVNARVLWFTVLASLVAGVLAGFVPAIQSGRASATDGLADGRGNTGSRSRLRDLLTVLQAAMSVVLLVGAGLFIRSLGEVRNLDLGVDADRVLMAEIEFVDPALSTGLGSDAEVDRTRLRELHDEGARLVRSLPSVESAAVTSVPLGWAFSSDLSVPGMDSLPTLAGGGPYYFGVEPDYFSTLGIAVTAGRGVRERDGVDDEPVTVVSETMARTLWPEGDAVGSCLYVGEDAETCTTVVGVVEDASRGILDEDPFMAYYLPLAQMEQNTPRAIYVRVAGPVGDAAQEVAATLRTFSPEVRFANVRTIEEILDPQARSWTLGATMFSVFGLLALVLAAIGLYSVLAFDIAQRTRELGIRTALGAEKRALLGRVLIRGVRLAGVGLVGGVAAASFFTPQVADLLFEVSPHDPFVLVSVTAVLLVVSLVASLVPGLRATRVDPMVALRSE